MDINSLGQELENIGFNKIQVRKNRILYEIRHQQWRLTKYQGVAYMDMVVETLPNRIVIHWHYRGRGNSGVTSFIYFTEIEKCENIIQLFDFFFVSIRYRNSLYFSKSARKCVNSIEKIVLPNFPCYEIYTDNDCANCMAKSGKAGYVIIKEGNIVKEKVITINKFDFTNPPNVQAEFVAIVDAVEFTAEMSIIVIYSNSKNAISTFFNVNCKCKNNKIVTMGGWNKEHGEKYYFDYINKLMSA